jgi:hypothetical protein
LQEKNVGIEQAFEVCEKACKVFLKRRADVYLSYCMMLEQHGSAESIERARSLYKHVLE